jgi:hypothetical protein
MPGGALAPFRLMLAGPGRVDRPALEAGLTTRCDEAVPST